MTISLLSWLTAMLPGIDELPAKVSLRPTDYLELEGGMVLALGAAGSALAGYVRSKFLALTRTYALLETRLAALEQTLHSIDDTLKARAAQDTSRGPARPE